jgi:GntR family transcriptional regulator
MTLQLQLDPHDPAPIYAKLDRTIRFAIASGRLLPGQQLPTVRRLAVDLRINANTVAKVYLALERDGVVETKRGVGTFILPPRKESLHIAKRKEHLRTLTEKYLHDAAALGFSPAVVLEYLRNRTEEGE